MASGQLSADPHVKKIPNNSVGSIVKCNAKFGGDSAVRYPNALFFTI